MDRIEQLEPTGLFGANVPRYTSYPTAPHFSDAFGAAEAGRWLAELPGREPLSLYLHIPFCERLCWFCACRTQGVRNPEPVARYLEVLKAEIGLLAAALGERRKVARIHWGGGTPTILSPTQIIDLTGTLRRNFDIAPDAEFSVEIDPTAVDEAKIDALALGGMTRASIGIQDFDPAIQRAIGRAQSFDLTARVVRQLRAAGIVSLNTDIVYGLPGQTLDGIRASTEAVLSLDPDRVALFGYAHVPWIAKRQRMIDADTLPGPQARLALVEQTETQFVRAGYQALGIDHFARPGDSMALAARQGRLRRNFQGYTDDNCEALIGLGASSIWKLPGGYLQNAPATAHYAGRVQAGHLAVTKGYALSLEDRVRAAFIERFLCDMSVELGALEKEFGSFVELIRPDINRALDRFGHWLYWHRGQLRLSPDGKPLARLIASEFDAFLRGGTARHSQAI
ncbi:oxygen-independent coproporphyrinogen III oxidase [Halovulum dunhuangense]|uniref:Coproporphyrinogen-III oxidase n=1 Tax=Halovulum dunhuangense TaxID=1505036 RepID=A0A849KYU4_9RHOB|nr:oxygen-independent coproporphyrinogen III oxidase [Halovulum dunhuangense]NNU78952.1 oxygen-independent coproporphyrinogen III oxidase [Halovulum dunhuangense]